MCVMRGMQEANRSPASTAASLTGEAVSVASLGDRARSSRTRECDTRIVRARAAQNMRGRSKPRRSPRASMGAEGCETCSWSRGTHSVTGGSRRAIAPRPRTSASLPLPGGEAVASRSRAARRSRCRGTVRAHRAAMAMCSRISARCRQGAGATLLLGALATAACGGSSRGTRPVAAAGTVAADDDPMASLKEYHRFHHHGGVTLFVAMSLDTLGVSPDQQAAVERIRTALHAEMEPARVAEQSLVNALADGLAAGTIDPATVEAAVMKVTVATAAVHDASATSLNELHRILTPAQRAALVDKVESHWAVWQRANAESGPAAGDDDHIAVLTRDLGLTADQAAKLRAGLGEGTKLGADGSIRRRSPRTSTRSAMRSGAKRSTRRASRPRAMRTGKWPAGCGSPRAPRRGRTARAHGRAARRARAASTRAREPRGDSGRSIMSWTCRARPLRGVVCIVAFGAALVLAGCELQAGPDYPGGDYLDYPPDAYIATTEPWYFDGQACYWYGGMWYYRSGGGWGHYNHEPAALRARRQQGGGQARHSYESSGGHFRRSRGRGPGRRGWTVRGRSPLTRASSPRWGEAPWYFSVATDPTRARRRGRARAGPAAGLPTPQIRASRPARSTGTSPSVAGPSFAPAPRTRCAPTTVLP